MKYHRLNEVIKLLQPLCQEYPELNLAQLLQKLADEAGFKGDLCGLTDDTFIYHLKMRNSPTEAAIPGLQKEHENDFKTALLRARGIIKD
ncbi:YihD family protein [Arsenophonus endosymbiont of Bemisia tabaci]|uniref:YihD family protein n=1 Tax=Arsenophonus endosymbiont of Bemisia tabaci TaxID=536059 RepID=UPI0015F582FB|nr:DUF1040 family protein [Arsenophonus endosymbiont of Bemisia tabaci]CAA2930009.1 hypothetical protein ARSQ2_01123 [Arsenophonus endosymbiont of Bemisia tabaci Q2]